MPQLSTLEPWLVPWAEYLLYVAKYNDARFVVTSARRSRTDQARLYARYQRGETTIPAAPPGRSAHEWGHAFDIARIGIDPRADPLLAAVGRLWTSWGGKYGGAHDPVHFGV